MMFFFSMLAGLNVLASGGMRVGRDLGDPSSEGMKRQASRPVFSCECGGGQTTLVLKTSDNASDRPD